MGLVKNISIIGLVAVLSFYRTEAAVTQFTKPATADAVVAGKVTTGVTASVTTTTAAVMIVENTALADLVVTTVQADDDGAGTVTYAATTTPTIFTTDAASGAISVSGTNTASVSSSPYTYVVEATDSAGGAVGTVTITITVNALPTFNSGTRCWLIADAAAVATSLATYSANPVESSQSIAAYTISGTNAADFVLVSGLLATASIMAAPDTYSLVLEAADDGAMPATGTLVVFVSVEGTTTESCGTAGLLGSLLVVMAVLAAQVM